MKNKKPLRLVGIGIATILFLFLGFFIFKNQATAPSEKKVINSKETNANSTQLANPASTKCDQIGGTITMKTRGDGGQYGLCELESGMACEEWALYRGECPEEGVDTSILESEIQMYCVWIGGELDNVNKNTCTLVSGKVCDTNELYNGICPAS